LTRTRLLAAAALALLAGAAGPAPGATLEGRVIHPTRPEQAVGVEVLLFGVRRGGGEVIERRASTDAAGSFRFEELPAGAAYVIAASYAGLTFPGRSVVLEAEDEEATREVSFHVYDRSDDASPLAVRGVQWTLRREAGVHRVEQTVRVHNPTLRLIAVAPDAPPALRVPLPAGHGEVELPSPFGRPEPGIEPTDGALELRGPFLPGERDLRFAYDLADEAGLVETSLAFEHPVELLDLRVRDFGVVVEAGDLHPARPLRDSDGLYLRWLGFDLPAGASLPLRLEPLPPRRKLPAPARALAVAALAGALLLLVVRPVTALPEAAPAPDAGREAGGEREALFAALRDLEHDFETGKISEADRERLREEMRRETLAALARERAPAAEAHAPEAARRCDCGHVAQPDDRFCASCGKPL
jgi:hypothetical protein